MSAIAFALCLLTASTGGAAPHAGPAFAPPPKSIEADLYPIPADAVADYLAQLTRQSVFHYFEGQNDSLKAKAASSKLLTVGHGLPLDMAAADLFQAPFNDGTYWVFLGAVVSVDAQALRLQVDLSSLADDEEMWVIDPSSQRPFGPYRRADHLDGGRWLPTIEGDTAVLVIRSGRTEMPRFRLLGLAHFFWSPTDLQKLLPCNVNIACDPDAAAQDVSTGIGIMLTPSNGDMALCTGTLINNPDTPQLEPYFLTSYHCVPRTVTAAQVDIIWDFRYAACTSSVAPSFSTLPRSNGQSVLVTSSTLDITLMRLDNVSSGANGRTYVGWDTNLPQVGDQVAALHFPQGTAMRISRGRVIGVDLATPTLAYIHQTEAVWDSGVTEPGSSGAALLSSNYEILGTLSNGVTHTCSADRSGNTDRFSSFRSFYNTTNAKLYLSGSSPPSGTGTCPAKVAFKDNPCRLSELRAFRDAALRPTALGRQVVRLYYVAAPTLAEVVRHSAPAKDLFIAVATPVAEMGNLLEPHNSH